MILSLIVLIIISYGLYKRINIYDKFVEGAKDSYNIILSLFPCLLAMILGINIFISSGFISDILVKLNINIIPNELLTLMILRPISGSSSLAVLTNIFDKYGTDSFIGVLSSVMQGATDTTIYILTLYFGSIGIKKTRYALINGLLADIFSFIMSFMVVFFCFN